MSRKDEEDDHRRSIIHIDLDCFYAQVEMIKDPSLASVPLGIQQKNIVVTSNYVAREYGVKKCMLVKDALKLCPRLVLVKGEDLHDYRQTSYKVTNHLQRYSAQVERLGLDENYVDVSALVDERLRANAEPTTTVGHVYGQEAGDDDVCQCGCYERLRVASGIAHEIRESLRTELKLTSCAGVAHNKLLAKLVGATHKPNQQTVVFPNGALQLMLGLKGVEEIPGIGKATADILSKIGVNTIEDLQNCEMEKLTANFPPEKAKSLRNMAFGYDTSTVKCPARPNSIGLEDSCRSISVEMEVREKIDQLLKRLMVLVNEDGRIPRTVKLVVRKFDPTNKVSHRESRQCNVNPSVFASENGIRLTETSHKKLTGIIMALFLKVVDIKRPYHVTLLGLSFTKFQERAVGKSSIASFLKKNMEVQTVTSIENSRDYSMECTNFSQTDLNTDGSESDLEPSPKKTKLTTLIAKRRCFNKDYPSPSKLNVASLRINSTEISCPPNVDEDVFGQLPAEMQEELWRDYVRTRDREQKLIKKPKVNTLLNYFVRN